MDNRPTQLPQVFADWFRARGWSPRPHQLQVLDKARAGRDVLLISPTGGGKTLAGFLPSLVELANKSERRGIHTLYVSPLKALAVDIARNLEAPIREMALPVRVETRTGDTPHSRRKRQRENPPDILITTPEQVSLLISDPGAAHLLKDLRAIVLDELHSLVTSKRGVLLSLALSRVQTLAPMARRIGLSATVADPDALRAWLTPQDRRNGMADLVLGSAGAAPHIRILKSAERVPWAGHTSRYAFPEVYEAIKAARMTLIFVNTRSQAEMTFQGLWTANEDHLPIALHHGSLDVAQRRKVEAAMAAGKLRAVVCTSTLDLGIDWGDVDLVIHVGAPKGSSRLLQRIGRSNHRLDEPSQALLVPSNRFEVLECEAARHAAAEGAQDTEYPRVLKLDVLAQHILCRACASPFHPDQLYDEVKTAWTYRNLTREDFDRAVEFVTNGGYALKAYERYAKLRPWGQSELRLAHPRLAQQYRLNMGTIIEAEMLKVRLAHVRKRLGRRIVTGGRTLGEMEEWFLSQLSIGNTFVFGGEILRFEGLDEFGALASRASASDAAIPSYEGGKFPLSTYLAERVREMLADPKAWPALPASLQLSRPSISSPPMRWPRGPARSAIRATCSSPRRSLPRCSTPPGCCWRAWPATAARRASCSPSGRWRSPSPGWSSVRG